MSNCAHRPRVYVKKEDTSQVISLAHSLGMHGVYIMGMPCEHCGCVHDFVCFSDIEPSEVPAILKNFVTIASSYDPEHVETNRVQ